MAHAGFLQCQQLLLRYLFEQRNVIKVTLDTNLENRRAQHMYEKIGFRKVRVKHDFWQDQMGEWQSAVDYAMTAEEYQRLDWA